MRYFVIEDGVDVFAYNSFESAVDAIEPDDIGRTRLFDERGNEYSLSMERKQVRFLWIWPIAVASTSAVVAPSTAAVGLEDCLREYVGKVALKVCSNMSLPELVDLVATYQGVD